MKPIILAIDTSCDETSAAVTCGYRVLSNVISSQIDLHKKYGGVYPALAKRAHEERIDFVISEAIRRAVIVIASEALYRPVHGEVKQSRSGLPRPADSAGLAMTQSFFQINAIAVTQGPGLAIALEIGIKKAKQLVLSPNPYHLSPKLIAINHLEGHIYSCLAETGYSKSGCGWEMGSGSRSESEKWEKDPNTPSLPTPDSPLTSHPHPKFPALCLIVSGGHTELVLMTDHGKYEVIGETLDDACGEALDKAAKILRLGYPGGPIIERLAEEYIKTQMSLRGVVDDEAIPTELQKPNGIATGCTVRYIPRNDILFHFSQPLPKKSNLNFSYSGLKTQFLYLVQKMAEEEFDKNLKELAFSFQSACFEQIIRKTSYAIKKYQPKTLINGGGVIANKHLRRLLRRLGKDHNIPVLFPPKKNLITDNAAMVGIAAYHKYLRKEFIKDIESLDREPRLHL